MSVGGFGVQSLFQGDPVVPGNYASWSDQGVLVDSGVPVGGGGGGMSIGGAVTGGTAPSILFINPNGILAQDPTNFGWDFTNKVLLIEGQNAIYRVPNASGDNWFEGGAGSFSLSGFNNFGTGPNCMTNLTSASSNTGIGAFALQSLTTGSGNVAVGTNALRFCISGTSNFAMGTQALSNCTAGQQNVGVGSGSLQNCTGSFNIAVTGLGNVTSGTDNLGIGFTAGGGIVTGVENTLIGSHVAINSGDFQYTIAIGAFAYQHGSDSFNTIIGTHAARSITSGSYNTFLGMSVVENCTGACANNTIIGPWPGPSGIINNIIAITDGTATANGGTGNISGCDFNYTTSDVWSFYKGINPIGLHVYKTTDSAVPTVNYERGGLDWNLTSNTFRLFSAAGGSGTIRIIAIDGFAKAGAPANTDLPAGTWALIDDTSGGNTWLVFNKAGTIRKVQLV